MTSVTHAACLRGRGSKLAFRGDCAGEEKWFRAGVDCFVRPMNCFVALAQRNNWAAARFPRVSELRGPTMLPPGSASGFTELDGAKDCRAGKDLFGDTLAPVSEVTRRCQRTWLGRGLGDAKSVGARCVAHAGAGTPRQGR